MAFASYVFDGLDDVLEFVWQSTAPDADRRKWTLSFWAKTTENVNVDPEESNPYTFGFQSMFFDEEEEQDYFAFFSIWNTWKGWPSEFYVEIGPDGWKYFEDPYFDTKVWHHYVVAFDSTQANEADRIKIYIDGQLVTPAGGICNLNAISLFFLKDALFELGRSSYNNWFYAGKLAFFQIVSGQALTPDAFGEERGGVWRHKPYEGSYGDWGLCLDGTDGFNDVSGNGFHFTQSGGVQLDPNDLPLFHEKRFASYVFNYAIDDIIQHVWSSTGTDAERRVWTVSLWVKLNLSNNDWLYWEATDADGTEYTYSWIDSDGVYLSHNGEMGVYSEETPDNDVWTHYVFRVDTTLSNAANRFRIYCNGSLLSPDDLEAPPRNTLTAMFQSGGFIAFYGAARLAFLDVVSGQSLGPDAFAFDNGGIWTRKPYAGSYGNFGFSLDGTDGFNDVSGNGFHFTQSGGVQLDPNDLPPYRAGFSAIYLGETQINAIKLGSTDIKAVYLGSTKIFES